MPNQGSDSKNWNPSRWFYFGLAIVMLALWLPFVPAWPTFIHGWRVEIAASIFLLATSTYLFLNFKHCGLRLGLSNEEINFVVLPLAAMIVWSAFSAAWAPSWKSAIHHSMIWAEYLIFYVIIRLALNRSGRYETLLTVFVLTLALVAIPAVIEYCAFLVFGGGTTMGMRYAKWGEQVVTLLPLAIAGVLTLNGRRFAVGVACVCAMWLLVFCSFGKINFILFSAGLAVCAALIFIFKQFHEYRRKFAVLVVVLVLSPAPLHLFSLASGDPNVVIVKRLGEDTAFSGDSFRKLMIAISFEMISANPIVGVGADNFGLQVNNYRSVYADRNPEDPNLSVAESEIPGHAHNEFLQIWAELGTIGAIIFAWFLTGIAILGYRAVRRLGSGSLYPIAAVLGLAMFLASSLVSAYSFRVMQNGIVFFFVLAVAAILLPERRRKVAETTGIELSPARLKMVYSACVVACLSLTTYSAVRVVSVFVATQANYTSDLGEATQLYKRAMRIDDENPDAPNNLGMRFFREGCYTDAIPYLESAIGIGKAPSATFSYTASAYSLAGDNAGAERIMARAVELYPRSPFVLTRYAALLNTNGKTADAELRFEQAMRIDKRAAGTWRIMINNGSQAATDMAFKDKSHAEVMDLVPQSSMYAVLAERHVRYPAERIFPF